MPAAALFLLLLLPPADTTGDLAAGLQTSLREQLGDVAMAIVPDTLVTPAMWQGPGAAMRARFVARVAWLDQDRVRIELLATQAHATPVSARDLAFAPQDSKPERGRAVGLALAELLRESPAAAFSTKDFPAVAAPSKPSAPRLAVGASFATERALPSHWAFGPKLTYGIELGHALLVEARGMALFAADQYSDLGFGLGLRWDILRSGNGGYAVGVALGFDVFREAASGGDDQGTAAAWNAGLGVGLATRLRIWRWLHAVVQADLRAVYGDMTLVVGEDAAERRYPSSHWRPGFSLGLEVSL